MSNGKQLLNPKVLFNCNDCNLSFKYELVLKMHISTVHKASKKRSYILICTICEMKFNSKISLVFHYSKDHSIFTKPQKSWKAGFCPECQTKQLCILDHMNRVHLLPKIQCNQCNFETRSKQSLDLHFNRRHTDSTKEQCTSCGQIFKNLRRHHTNTSCGKSSQKLTEKASCQQCGKLLPRNMVARHI